MYRFLLTESCYFAPVAHWSLAVALGTWQLEAYETYQKGGFRNRCRIAGPNGALLLTVPLERGKNEKQAIQEVQISYRQDWQRQHWQSIQTAYGNAPFFEYYEAAVRHCYENAPAGLWEWQKNCRQTILKELELPVTLSYSDTYRLEPTDGGYDLRSALRTNGSGLPAVFEAAVYPQLFRERYGFLSNLSILDLLFCAGPQAISYLQASVPRLKESRP